MHYVLYSLTIMSSPNSPIVIGANELHAARARAGYRSAAALARGVGLSENYIRLVLLGKVLPAPETRAKIATAIGLSPSAIWGDHLAA